MKNDFAKTIAQKIIAERGARIELIVLTNNGKDSFYYIMMKESQYQDLMRDSELNKEINIYNYGTILLYGDGDTPPAEIEKMVQECIKKAGL